MDIANTLSVDISGLDFSLLESGVASSVSLPVHQEKRELSPERIGVFTASGISVLTEKGRGREFSKAAMTYIRQVAAERLTGLSADSGYVSAAMQWGIDNEAAAIDWLEKRTGIHAVNKGDEQEFFLHESGVFGATPDGVLVADNSPIGVIEVKCLSSARHLEALTSIRTVGDLKDFDKAYYWQSICQMLAVDMDAAFFCFFDPRFKDDAFKYHGITFELEDVVSDAEYLMSRIMDAGEMVNQICSGAS